MSVDDIDKILENCQKILECKRCEKYARNILRIFD